jgi:flavin-dependent dehydrogenase
VTRSVLDLLVVGGGPAGLATALYAQARGLDVAVVESRYGPIDKACGEGLMPPALAALGRLGIEPSGQDFRGIRYVSGTHEATADFRSGNGRGVRRMELHAAMQAEVQRRGIEIVHRRVHAVDQDDAGVTAAGLRARHLVAADGLHSPIRRQLGLDKPRSHGPVRYGIRAHYAVRPWSDRVEVHWSPIAEAYVTPVGSGCVGVAVLGGNRGPFDDRLALFPALRARLPDQPVDRVRGAGPLRQNVRARVAGRVLLVGDAAGYVDALTGEGLAISFACAEAVVACLGDGRAADYEREYRTLTRRYRLITSALLAVGRRPTLRRLIVPAAERVPALFAAAVHQLGQ